MPFLREKRPARLVRRREGEFIRHVFRDVIRLAILAVLLTAVWYVTRLPALTIASVSVTGGETIAHDVIRDRVLTELTGTYLLLVPKRFSYLYPKDRIREVVEAVPRVRTVAVARPSHTELLISFEEYIPYALWCTEREDVPCWFIDREGYAFTEAPQLTGGTFVRHTVLGSGDMEGGTVIAGGKLRAIERFLARAEVELGFRMTSLTHRVDGDIEFLVNGGGSVLVAGEKDFETTFENLRTVLSAPEFQHIAPGNFRYVDVRFDNKVFVNEEREAEPAATAATSTLPGER